MITAKPKPMKGEGDTLDDGAVPIPTPNIQPSVRYPIPTPNRRDRKIQFGIDCAELVHFTHWEPGGEHVKQLVVKNVVMKTQKIKYKLPQTRYFSMEFPETQTLSAGMSWSVPITFRPVAKESYHDVIEFTTSFGKFYLPVKATLPEHVLEFPEAVDFGLCPVKETAKKTFVLKNIGELTTHFEWQIQEPFNISPRIGMLAPSHSTTVTIEFTPSDGSVFSVVATCSFGDKGQWEKSVVTKPLTIYGIGKYSHLVVQNNTHTFDFGDVYVGKSAERKFVLENHSVVHANFRIARAERDTDPYFNFSITTGTVPSKKSLEISITYTPVAAGVYSNDYFDIKTLSGNTIRITCKGCGMGPKVTINPKIVNFGDVLVSSVTTRALYLQNNSNTPAFYQILTEMNSTFSIDKPWGTINPNSTVALTVKFCGSEPINYYRRVYCLVEHQDAIFVDFLGTCYNDKRRPATFRPQQIFNYHERVKNGLWSHSPEQLEEMIKAGTIKCEKGVLSYVDTVQAEQNCIKTVLDSPYDDAIIASEYFYENTGDALACTLIDTYVDFGACSRYRVIEPQTIRIANNTKGKMSCVWILPGENSTNEDPVFSVTPRVCDIPSKSIAEFKVNFWPKVDNSFYGAQLECFVYFKSMRNFRLVNEDTFTPPWCLTPTIAGNTFPPGEDTFIPKIGFGATRLDFPACHVDKSVYRTVRVTNSGDTSVKFSFLDSGIKSIMGIGGGTNLASRGGATFSVKPRIGILHKAESRLIVFRFSPSEEKVWEEALKCFFNSSLTNSYDLQMRGVGYYPQVTFENNNRLFFKPTCIGSIGVRSFTIRNTSRISVNFDWHIPEQYSSLVAVEPMHGTLAPNSIAHLTCTLAPSSVANLFLKLPCYYSHGFFIPNLDAETQRRATLCVLGKGMRGEVIARPASVEFGSILVNTVVEHDLYVFNPTECDVYYTLEIQKVSQHPENQDQIGAHHQELEIVQRSRVLPARSSQTLKVKACVKEQLDYEFEVFYRIDPQAVAEMEGMNVPKLLKSTQENERFRLCNVTAVGVHPFVQITDIKCEGFSKSILWDLFSLELFNSLLKEVRPDPYAYAEQTFQEDAFPTEPQPGTAPTPEVNFDFAASSVGCRPTVFNVCLRNNGVVPVDWVFHFPNDLEVEVENWADPGDYTEEQLHHTLILDNNIFCVTPKSGHLIPGDSCHVLLSYSHEFAGSHRLPVIFKLKNGPSRPGKEIVVNFSGYSVPPAKKYLHIQNASHTFTGIPISTSQPPVQSYRLMNRGSLPLEYYIDTEPLKQLQFENYQFEIFKCLKTHGTIQPGGVEYVDWIFNPLEAKEYQVDVPISVSGGKTKMITFRGNGLDTSVSVPEGNRVDPKQYDDNIPNTRSLDMPNQPANISLERITFGHVPLHTINRRIVVVQNISDECDITFKWRIPYEFGDSVFKVIPSQGRLGPNESKVCKVIYIPSDPPRIYDFDIICEIMNETEAEAYAAQKLILEKARGEGRYVSSVDVSRAPSREKLKRGSAPSTTGKFDLNRLKYRPLPSISPSVGDDPAPQTLSDALSTPALMSEEGDIKKAPEPLELFLSVRSWSHGIDEHRGQFSNYEAFYHVPNMKTQEPIQQRVDATTVDVITDVTLSLLNDIFKDENVARLPQRAVHDPLPYYAQISSHPERGIYDRSSEHDKSVAITKDKRSNLLNPEFQNLVETVLEGTLYNLMQEANVDEFNLFQYPILLRDDSRP